MAKANKKPEATPEVVKAQELDQAVGNVENVENVENLEVIEEKVVAPVEELKAPEAKAPEAKAKAVAPKAPEKVEAVEVEEATEATRVCLGLKDHTCRIGTAVINVYKDQEHEFTVGVSTVLQRAGVVIVK